MYRVYRKNLKVRGKILIIYNPVGLYIVEFQTLCKVVFSVLYLFYIIHDTIVELKNETNDLLS